MKIQLERLPEYVTVAVTILIGMAAAASSGLAIGRGQFGMIGAMLVAAVGVITLVGLRAGIWLIIPFGWELLGTMPVTRLPFNIRESTVLFAAGGFAFLYALKAHRVRPKIDAIDFLVWANIVYLVSVFIRNPVGTKFMNSAVVGGRPYFDALMGFLAFLVLARAPTAIRWLKAMPLAMLTGTIVVGFAGLITALAPSVAISLSQIYTGFLSGEAMEAAMPGGVTGRVPSLAAAGMTGVRLLTSYLAPITLITPAYPLRFALMMISLLLILFSGFRSAVFAAGAYFAMGTWFRRRWKDLLVVGIAGAVAVMLLCLGNGTAFTLPLPIQRALAFLPGKWDERVVADAKDSVDWRLDMWEIALQDDKWIKNKLLGDGYGFTMWELSIIEDTRSGRGFVGGSRQEGFLIAGLLHHGPLTTIRYVGVVGMILFFSLLVVLSFHTLKLIRASKGHALFPVALFVGMPILLLTLTYPFGGGDFRFNFSDTLFWAGLVKLLNRGVKDHIENPLAESALPEPKRPSPTPRRRALAVRHGS
jgi:hypothetical protein